MAYVKQTWQTGEVITADKLNHMEDGIGSCVMVVGATTDGNTITLDKTWQEIYDAVAAGKVIVRYSTGSNYAATEFVSQAVSIGTSYAITTIQALYNPTDEGANAVGRSYIAESANDYPATMAIS